jgi:hypothetical protein
MMTRFAPRKTLLHHKSAQGAAALEKDSSPVRRLPVLGSARNLAAPGSRRTFEAGPHGDGTPLYTKAVLDGFLHRIPVPVARMPVACCRVSSAARKPDLTNQGRVLEDFCAARGVANTAFVEEVGGGLNRPKFVADGPHRGAANSHLIIAHKDRLVRFGFPWFERFAQSTVRN